MYRRLAAVLTAVSLAAGALISVRAQSARKTTPASAEALGFDAQRLARLDAYMAKTVASGRVPGMVTLLARHGQTVQEKSYGVRSLAGGAPMSADTIVRLYSMSKPITGVAMMMLWEEGRWRLDEPVTDFVPEFRNLKVFTGKNADGTLAVEPVKRPMTMRQLMSHSAGFGYGLFEGHPVDQLYREKGVLSANGLPEMIKRTADIPLMYQPGTQWSYSSAVDIQGYIIEKISGQKFGEFLQQRVFQPLKMTDTAFYVPREKASRLAAVYIPSIGGKLDEAKALFGSQMPTYLEPPALESGGGGLLGTIADYARFAQMLANKGTLDGVRLLAPATVELMGTNMLSRDVLARGDGLLPLGLRFDETTGFGLDFQVMIDPRAAGHLEGKGTISWEGAAGTWFWVDPTNDVVFVGLEQRLGDVANDSPARMARTLTYQALVHPEK